jgi:hypothetical protein
MQILLGLAGSAARGCPAQAEYDLGLFGGNFNGPQIYVFSKAGREDPTPDPAPRRSHGRMGAGGRSRLLA